MEALRLEKYLKDETLAKGMSDRHPTPFPGRWPTRIAWKSGRFNQETYIGKPDPQQVQRFNRLYGMFGGVLVEFDRTHIPIYRLSNFYGLQTHSQLYPYYHFWISADYACSHLVGHHGTKAIDGHMVYTPWIALHDTRRAEWRAYQTISGVKL